MKTTLVVGNPKPRSRTLAAGTLLMERLTGSAPDRVIDVVDLGAGLLGWGDEAVAEAVAAVQQSEVVIMASPTFKATYTGLIKLFLDQFAGGTGLKGVATVPLMLGAASNHSLAPDLLLKPVLVELGATCALPGLYLIDKSFATDGALTDYADRWAPVLESVISMPTARP